MKFFLLIFLSLSLIGCVSSQSSNPANVQTHLELGLAYLKYNNLSAAKKQLLLTEQKQPNNPEVLDSLAYFYQQTKNSKVAESYYQKAIILNPHSSQAKNNYAVFLCFKKHYSEAIKLFEQALENPNYLNAYLAKQNLKNCQKQARLAEFRQA